MSGDSIGMMEGAFFVSKGIIIDWINELLDVSYSFFIRFILILFSISFKSQRLNNAPQELSIAR